MRVDCRAILPFIFMCIKPKSTFEELFTRGGYIRALSIPMHVSPLKPLTYFVTVVVEASAPKAYPAVALASVSILSGSVVRTLRSGEGLPMMLVLVASSLGHHRSQCSIACCSSLQRGHSGSAEVSMKLE